MKGGVRKTRTSYSLDVAVEERLLEWIEANPGLWKTGSMAYKKKADKEAKWAEKAAEEELEPLNLKMWWKGIHDTYTRLHSTVSGQALPELTERQQWIRRHLGFYAPQVKHRGKGAMNDVSILIMNDQND